jgi:hypothetical protein
MRKLLATVALSIAAACSPAYAETQPFDLSTIDVLEAIETPNGYTMFFTNPENRPCFDDVGAWWADAQARGYVGVPVAGIGENRVTGEPTAYLMILDEPQRGETWGTVGDDPRLCLHIVIELDGI